MFYIILFLVNFILLGLCILYKIKKIEVLLAVNIFSFFAEYIICSGFLFWFENFSVSKVLFIMLIGNLLLLSFLIIKNKRIALDYEKQGINIPLIIILLVAVPFSVFKFGYWGFGQDQGVYQVKAIDLMYTDTLRQKTFDEYQNLSDNERKVYFEAVKKLAGYELYDVRKPFLPKDEKQSDVDGIYHGIPTYPAILALSGYMFGIENISALNTLVYIGIILLMNALCSNFKINRMNTFLTLFITALSPIVIWLTKATLTELILTLIFISYLYFITVEKGQFYSAMSVISIAAFSFFHVSIYTLIPFFLVCYMIRFIKSGDRTHFVAAVAACVMMTAGLCMMLYVSPTYASNNMVNPIGKIGLSFINDYNIISMLVVLQLLFMGIFFALCFWKPINSFFVKFTTKKLFTNSIRILSFLMLLVCCYNVLKNGTNNLWNSIQTNTLVSFVYLTGIVVFPIVIVLVFVKLHKLLSEQPTFLLFFSFFYCILFRSAFLGATTSHYYYYARYLAPFVPIIAMLIGVLMTKKAFSCILTVCSAFAMLPYDMALFSNNDDTMMDWENIVDVADYIDSKDAVLVSDTFLRTHFIPIKEMTGAHVYPFSNTKELNSQCESLSEKYEDIFLLTDMAAMALNDNLVVVYSDIIHESQDLQGYRNKYIPLPLDFYKKDYEICLMKYNGGCIRYNLPINTVIYEGFIEESNFAWSIAEDSSLYIPVFSDSTLDAEIIFDNYIPFAALGMEHYNVDVYVNDIFYETIDLVSQKSLHLILSSKIAEDNSGVYVQFHSQLWSPSWVGSSDPRMLGFPVSQVILSKFEEKTDLSFAEGTIQGEGFGAVEGNIFAWSREETPKVYCSLEHKDYTVTITCRPIIPVSQLGLETYHVRVYMNGSYIGLMELGKTIEENICTFNIPSEKLVTGKNVLSFQSELWTPTDVGLSDARLLGFALESICFE